MKRALTTGITDLKGAVRKLLDVSRFRSMGWRAKIHLREGFEATFGWYLETSETIRARDAFDGMGGCTPSLPSLRPVGS